MNVEEFCDGKSKTAGSVRDPDSPVCSLPLKTYSLQPNVGFRASGGSLYFRTVPVPSAAFTVFVAAASNPDGLKFGLALSTGLLERVGERERRLGEAERRDCLARSLLFSR